VVKEIEPAKYLLLAGVREHRGDERNDLRRRDEPVVRDDLEDFHVAVGLLESRNGSRAPLEPW
jgi:hypothetical protein